MRLDGRTNPVARGRSGPANRPSSRPARPAALMLLAVWAASGCAIPRSAGEYFRFRGRDLAQCVRCAAGVGYGVHIKVHPGFPSPLPLGIGASRTQEFGWDGGTGIGRFTWQRVSVTVPYAVVAILDFENLTSLGFRDLFSFSDESLPQNADFVRSGLFAILSGGDFHCEASPSIPRRRAVANLFWLGFDATLGVVSVRFGIRPHEILDAGLGLFCIDLCGDDREKEDAADRATDDHTE